MEVAFFWIIFGIIAGVVANNRGRSGAAWFFISLAISFIFAIIILLLLPDLSKVGAKDSSHPVAE